MKRWTPTLILGLTIIVITLAGSLFIYFLFNIIGSHLATGTQSLFSTLGSILFVIIGLVASILTIPASVIQVRQFFYDAEEKALIVRRQTFARERLRQIQDIGLQEDWKDEHFAELEAEVEAEGRRRIFSGISFLSNLYGGIRHERSLTAALASSQERLILVEGEPGSGKSVALRHVAETMAERAKNMQNTKSVIPILVNLKELVRAEGVSINKKLIEQFILETLKKKNDRDIEEFVEERFDQGLEDGSWLFLFDSFDELPEVLSSTEADATIKSYGNAIDDFLGGMNRCRGVVASRPFRGPGYLGWPRFRILPLSDTRRIQLIRKLGLRYEVERQLIQELGIAEEEIRNRAGNPLFLTLLGKHMKSGNAFPNSAHDVFETYISSRFIRDKGRLQKRFNVDADQLRSAAEGIAYCMNADSRVGLSPIREKLRNAIVRSGIKIEGDLDTFLDALEYMKLARSDTSADATGSKSFTFAHRRFQEYFATCVVLREPSLFTPNELLTNERWRETIVTIFQTQRVDIDVIKPIMREASRLLRRYCASIPDLISNADEYVRNKEERNTRKEKQAGEPVPEPVRRSFPWPKGSLHLLNLLQDSFSSHLKDLPNNITASISILVLSATEKGILSDRKWALEVSGIVPENILTFLLKRAFSSKSQWLKEVAYRQAARLNDIPLDIAQGIRDTIIYLACTHRLNRERYATEAHLARIKGSSDFLSIMRLFLWLPQIDLALHALLLAVIIFISLQLNVFNLFVTLLLFGILYLSYISFRAYVGQLHNFVWSPIVVFFSRLMLSLSFFLIISLWKVIFWESVDQFVEIIILGLITIYTVLYSPFAYTAASIGKFTKIYWWPLLPILPILYFFTDVSLMIKAFVGSLIMIAAIWVFAIVFPLITKSSSSLSSVGPSNSTITTASTPPVWFQSFLNILLVLIIIAAVGGMLIGIGLFIWWVYTWGNDWLQWHRWNRSHFKQITCEELCKLVSMYHHKLFCAWLIRTVRKGRLLEVKDETESTLLRLAIATEIRQQFSVKEETLFKEILKFIEKGQQFDQDAENLASRLSLLGCPLEYFELIYKSNPEVTDEIYMLWEDMRAFKKYLLVE